MRFAEYVQLCICTCRSGQHERLGHHPHVTDVQHLLDIDLHCRIIAGPGSGKTRVLTSRVEYLIKEKGCKPWEMVVITFSNKAARELQDRLAVLLGQKLASQVIAGLPNSLYTHMQPCPFFTF